MSRMFERSPGGRASPTFPWCTSSGPTPAVRALVLPCRGHSPVSLVVATHRRRARPRPRPAGCAHPNNPQPNRPTRTTPPGRYTPAMDNKLCLHVPSIALPAQCRASAPQWGGGGGGLGGERGGEGGGVGGRGTQRGGVGVGRGGGGRTETERGCKSLTGSQFLLSPIALRPAIASSTLGLDLSRTFSSWPYIRLVPEHHHTCFSTRGTVTTAPRPRVSADVRGH